MGPEFHRVVSPRVTASRSLVRLSANAVRPGRPSRPSARTAAIQAGEFLAAELGEHLAEGADVAGGRAQFRALLQDRLEPHLVVLGRGGGVAGEPTGDLPHRGWGSLEGGLPLEKYVLAEEDGQWAVYYSERGERRDEMIFDSEQEACDQLFLWLVEDRTTRMREDRK